MTLRYVLNSIEYYPDPGKGRPLANASIYIGEPSTDPEVLLNRKEITLQQEDGNTVVIPPESQPIKTGAGGIVLYNGAYVQVLTDGDHSVKVLNSQGSQAYYITSVDTLTQQLWDAITQNAADIATNAENIATNTENIATNTENIATNTTNIATNTENIATNTENIATNTAEISDINRDMYSVISGENSNGYYRLHSDGYLEQWGRGETTDSATDPTVQKFPIPFDDNKEINVQLTCSASGVYSQPNELYAHQETSDSVIIERGDEGTFYRYVSPYAWRAIGYAESAAPVPGYVEYFYQPNTIAGQENFGWSSDISSDGQTAIVGATGTNGVGACYIIVNNSGSWEHQQQIIPADAIAQSFGYSVSISGDGNTVIIGAPNHTDGGVNSGVAYIYTRSGSAWTEVIKMQGSGVAPGDRFGSNVKISEDGETAVICAFQGNSAHVFSSYAGPWVEEQKLIASDTDGFGSCASVNSDGSVILIGSETNGTGGLFSGAAFIFTVSGGVWSEHQAINASDAAASILFGKAVAMSTDGSTMVVTATRREISGSDVGAAYIFEHDGQDWIETSIIAPDSYSAGNGGFGSCVDISGNAGTLVIGSAAEEIVYVYKDSGSSWNEIKKVDHSGAYEALGETAVSVDSSGNSILMGAYYYSAPDAESGAAYFLQWE